MLPHLFIYNQSIITPYFSKTFIHKFAHASLYAYFVHPVQLYNAYKLYVYRRENVTSMDPLHQLVLNHYLIQFSSQLATLVPYIQLM